HDHFSWSLRSSPRLFGSCPSRRGRSPSTRVVGSSEPQSKEDPMYARLISFSGADPEKRENAIQTMRETVIPMLRSYDGYAGYISLYDVKNSRARAII